MAKIVLVDDELTMVQMISEVLRGEGHEVFPFTSPAGVAEALVERHPDLVITDLYLDKTRPHGMEIIRKARLEAEIRARARFSMMAGNAALAGGDSEGAVALLEQAASEARSAAAAPLQALAAIDRARALVALDRQDEAMSALDEATMLVPESSEAWLLKATLLRRMNQLDAAQVAIETAAKLAPASPDICLEAGVIAVLAGRDGAARASWQSVIDLSADSPAAKQAKDYLIQLGPAPATPQEPPA